MDATFVLAALLCLGADSPAKPSAFEFKDAAAHENRSAMQSRAIEFRDSPARPLGDRKFEASSLYGLVPVGPTPETALTIVWRPKAAGGPELWLDANGDGRLTDDERHAMSGRSLEILATVTVQQKPEPIDTDIANVQRSAADRLTSSAGRNRKVRRTFVFRRSAVGDGLRYAVRGYMQGRVSLGGKEYAVVLIDGNANGCFDTVGQDRVWIDLNEDGRFDPLTEQFPLGKTIAHHGEVYVIRSDALAAAVVANLRSAGQGKLRLTLATKPSSAAKVSAELISDLGELVCVDKLDEAIAVPFGGYRLSSLNLEARDSAGRTWTYHFGNEHTMSCTVPTGQETTVPLLTRLAMEVSLELQNNVASPGQTLAIRPKLTTDQGFYLSGCDVGDQTDRHQAQGSAEILLLAPDGKVAARGLTGFS